MRIAMIGRFKRLYDEEGKARSFEKLGHEVFRFEEGHLILEDVEAVRPKVVIFTKLKMLPQLKEELLMRMKVLGIPTACWVPDLYFGLGRECLVRGKDTIFRADYVFTPDGGHEKEFNELGINHHVVRQGIFDEECFIGKHQRVPQIVFVGTFNPEFSYREKVMSFLSETYGDKFEWIGRSNSDEIRNSRLNNLYASTKIVVGDSVFSPYYWSNRIYETIGRGGFLIHPMVPGIEKEFTPYKHFIPYNYNDFKGLKEKIDFFLDHPKERQEIQKAGFEHCQKHHTLVQRCQELINIIFPKYDGTP